MTKRSFRKRCLKTAMALAMGGSAFQLSGCDPNVRQTVINGLQSTTIGLSAALITAFFQTLEDDATTGGLTTTG